jgi:hypothetical protein
MEATGMQVGLTGSGSGYIVSTTSFCRMGSRGPKALDQTNLVGLAGRWEYFLFLLRDGEDGAVFHVEWGPRKQVVLGNEQATVRAPLSIKSVSVLRAGDAWQELARTLSNEDFAIIEPVISQPELWNELGEAQSPRAIHNAAQKMRRWVARYRPRITGAAEFPRVVSAHAVELLEARKLPGYPRSDRPRSDDKRIEFFAKVLAGLELGIAAATAIKRLHGTRFPKTGLTEAEVVYMLRKELESGEIVWQKRKPE